MIAAHRNALILKNVSGIEPPAASAGQARPDEPAPACIVCGNLCGGCCPFCTPPSFCGGGQVHPTTSEPSLCGGGSPFSVACAVCPCRQGSPEPLVSLFGGYFVRVFARRQVWVATGGIMKGCAGFTPCAGVVSPCVAWLHAAHLRGKARGLCAT